MKQKPIGRRHEEKVVYVEGDNLFVVSLSPSSNAKITDSNASIVQTYTYSLEQWEIANCGRKIEMREFFALDASNCMDCPYSANSGTGDCYTHKYQQYTGFLSQLRSIKREQLTPIDEGKRRRILTLSEGRYVRFGTYGEPSLMDATLVSEMARVASSWTGYTHQWQKDWAKPFASWFMASVHTESEVELAGDVSFRSFLAKDSDDPIVGVQCPASKEAGYKSTCAKCGLCSGILGKGKKAVSINVH
jgi:hypothetical protein